MLDKIKIAFLKQFRHVKVFKFPLFMVLDPHTFDVKGHHYYEARKLIQPGDILLRSYKQYLDVYFIPGEYSHAALYIGGPNEEIIHAMTPDVQKTNLAHFMRCDKFCIVRPKVFQEVTKTAITRAQSKLGVPYDYDFVFETEDYTGRNFSCSELIYYCYQEQVENLGWKIEPKDYILFTKELFEPEKCLPQNDNSEIIYKV